MRRTLLNGTPLLVVLALVVAGCTSPPPVADPSGPPPISAERGAVEGLVTSNDLEPIQGAQVALQGLSRSPVVTDANGHFLIGDLAPDDYVVFVNALGYQALARPIEVLAGEVSEIRFSLAPVASDAASSSLDIKRGFISCGSGAGAQGAGFTQVGCGAQDPNQKFLFNYSVGPGLSGILFEMAWKPSQALSKDLVLIVEKDDCGFDCGVADTFAEIQGCCKLRVFLSIDQFTKPAGAMPATNLTKGGSIQSRTFPAFGEAGTPVTVFTSQEFRIYAEYFYRGLPADLETRSNVPAE